MKTTSSFLDLPQSGIRRMYDLAKNKKDTVSFVLGEPDFVTPKHIIEAAKKKLDEGCTHYTDNAGILPLRQEISRALKQYDKVDYDPEGEIVVTVGGMMGMYMAILALVNPGDEILIADPSYTIMRGCNNFCTYCIVPYTRGRERSRDVESILNEVADLVAKGYKEVTLLGQNVNSYRFEKPTGETVTFPMLLRTVAEAAPGVRIRFTTSHPKDMSDETLEVIAQVPNVCKHIHLPVQSGSSRILKLMNRKYTREWYLDRVAAIKRIIPDCGLTTDIFSGFHSETEEDHAMSLSLMEECGYDAAFMFKYSERPGTYASKHLEDNVPEEVKVRRLNEIIALQNRLSAESNQRCIGKTYEVLVEGVSKRSRDQLFGRTEQNRVVVFDRGTHRVGDFVNVRITEASSATLKGVCCNADLS